MYGGFTNVIKEILLFLFVLNRRKGLKKWLMACLAGDDMVSVESGGNLLQALILQDVGF